MTSTSKKSSSSILREVSDLDDDDANELWLRIMAYLNDHNALSNRSEDDE